MKVLLDTNVLIAAFLARGLCHDVLEHCERAHTLVTSAFILDEFEREMSATFAVPEEASRAARALIKSNALIVEPIPRESADGSLGDAASDAAGDAEPNVSADPETHPEDHPILATATAGECKCIVTGDPDLRDLRTLQTIVIVGPGEFWRFEAASGSTAIVPLRTLPAG